MCLAVPGKVLSIDRSVPHMAMGTVSFGGIKKRICLAYVPEAQVGDHVIVHVGFAIGRIDEAEAQEVFKVLERLGQLDELDPPRPA